MKTILGMEDGEELLEHLKCGVFDDFGVLTGTRITAIRRVFTITEGRFI